MNELTNRNETESELIASCDLVQHPDGLFEINGKPYRPEWGRFGVQFPAEEYSRACEEVHLAVAEANRICEGKDPKHVRLEIYNERRTRIIVQEN